MYIDIERDGGIDLDGWIAIYEDERSDLVTIQTRSLIALLKFAKSNAELATSNGEAAAILLKTVDSLGVCAECAHPLRDAKCAGCGHSRAGAEPR